jgi:MFS family permease
MSSADSSMVVAPGESVKRLLPWLVAVAFFMESLDTTILNTAVPTIATALAVAPLSMKAVLSSYTLSLAVFIPISGWMADRFGTRRVFSSAIGLFTIGSFLCGSMNTLAYADVTEAQASSASTIASTMQQMSISFGVATASLATRSSFRTVFIPAHPR